MTGTAILTTAEMKDAVHKRPAMDGGIEDKNYAMVNLVVET